MPTVGTPVGVACCNRLEPQLDQSLGCHFHIHSFISVMATNLLEARREDFSLVISEVTLKGFVSEHGVANFLNVPYATVPLRFRMAVPLPISAHQSGLDVSHYGPRCPQKANGLQDMMAHVFEKVTLSAAPDETNCRHLNIYILLLQHLRPRLPQSYRCLFGSIEAPLTMAITVLNLLCPPRTLKRRNCAYLSLRWKSLCKKIIGHRKVYYHRGNKLPFERIWILVVKRADRRSEKPGPGAHSKPRSQ
jgi:hypothetical protein